MKPRDEDDSSVESWLSFSHVIRLIRVRYRPVSHKTITFTKLISDFDGQRSLKWCQ